MNTCHPVYPSWTLLAVAICLLAAMQVSRAEHDEADAQDRGVARTGATWRVANNGVDSPDCGSHRRPCRTITQGIENAAPGDLVLVGPGLYGDVNGSCEFPQSAEEGEEFGFEACANVPNTSLAGARVCLNKAVTVASVEGAEATVIDACGSVFGVVVLGSNSAFGLPHRGFTVIQSSDVGGSAVAVSAPSNVTIGGNIAHPNPRGTGFQIQLGEDHRLVGNTARGAFRGFSALVAGTPVTRGLRITGNTAVSNNQGFSLVSENALVVRGNLAIGNDIGFIINGSGHILQRNSAVGNRNYGIWIARVVNNGAPIAVNQNNIFGNNTAALNGNVNCGVLNGTAAAVDATKNFWGAPTGPGANPADDACDVGGGQIIHTPFARKQLRLRDKWNSSKFTVEDEDAEESAPRAQ